MTRAGPAAPVRALAALAAGAAVALAAAGCIGPYADVGQKLDLALRVTGGEAWIAFSGTRTRILLLGKTSAGETAEFSLSRLDAPVAAGTDAYTVEGVWQEHGGTMIFTERVEYTFLDESGVGVTSRRGSFRKDGLKRITQADVRRTAARLDIAGDARFAGAYVPLEEALGRLGTSTPDDAACAFHVVNLLVMTSQVRVIGFGGPGMLQYRNPQRFEGTLSGGLTVGMTGGLLSPDVTQAYDHMVDFPGVELDGPQETKTGASGTGRTEGTLRFTVSGERGGFALPPIAGELQYDLELTNGTARGGSYLIRLDGGASTAVSPTVPQQPTVGACLGLP